MDYVGIDVHKKESQIRIHAKLHLRIMFTKQFAIGPMSGCLQSVQKARLGEHQRARADGTEDGALGVDSLQPLDLPPP